MHQPVTCDLSASIFRIQKRKMFSVGQQQQNLTSSQEGGRELVRSLFLDEGVVAVPSLIDPDLVATIRESIEAAEFKGQDPLFGKLRKDKRLAPLDQPPPWLSPLVKELAPFTKAILGVAGDTVVDIQYSVIETGRSGSPGWHIDGTWIAESENSLKSIPFFKLLVGVYLTDLTSEDRGNFMYAPGGHRAVASFFRTAASDILSKHGVGAVFKALSEVDVGHLKQLLVKPGDVIFAHALLPHSIASNSFKERPVLYLRMGEYRNKGLAALSDIEHESSRN